MIRALLQIVLNGVAVLVAAYLVPGITYTGSLPSLLLVGLVIGLINLIVKPIVTFFSFPLIVAHPRPVLPGDQRADALPRRLAPPAPPAGERLRRGDPGRPGGGARQLARAGLHLGVAARTGVTPGRRGGSPDGRGGERAGGDPRRGCAQTYPETRLALDFKIPLQLLMATVLAAQCTDERVNKVTPALFRRYPTARDYAGGRPRRARGDGPHHRLLPQQGAGAEEPGAGAGRRARRRGAGEHGGAGGAARGRPEDGQRRAGQRLRRNEGIAVDTHVQRLSRRLFLTEETDPEKIERDLMAGPAAGGLDALRPAAPGPRPEDLQGAQARMRRLPGGGPLPVGRGLGERR